MRPESLLELLKQVQTGQTSVSNAAEQLSQVPFEDTGFAKIDHHRSLRIGMPEAIYAAGKTPEQVAEIFFRMVRASGPVLATRATPGALGGGTARGPRRRIFPHRAHDSQGRYRGSA